MKTILLPVNFFVSDTMQTKVFYGTTKNRGSNKAGVICKLNAGTNNLTAVFSFDGKDGAAPFVNGLIQAADGKLYGTTPDGGNNGAGIIYSLDPATSVYTKLYDFDFPGGANSYETLLYAADGKFYGITAYGGNNDAGVIFSFDPVTSTYTKLYDFNGTDGGYSYGGLTEASDSKFYGLTAYGGNNGAGVIFSFDPSTSTFNKVYDFDEVNGSLPNGSLVPGPNDKLYGLTVNGGSNGKGVIFSFDPAISTFTKMYDLNDVDGIYPSGRLLPAADGKLYGMTTQGGDANAGTVFSIDPATSAYTKLHDFNGRDGANPNSYLLQAADGKLYGMTPGGGNNASGVIFSIDPATATYTMLHDFDGTNGSSPNGGFTLATDSKLYATARFGGTAGIGTIFSYNIPDSVFSTLKNFGTNYTGSNINGGLIKGSGNNLYGITYNGGTYGERTVFSFNAPTSTYTKLHDFNFTGGYHGKGTLLLASDGKLYRMTSAGGSMGYGVSFSYDLSTSTYTSFQYYNGMYKTCRLRNH